MERSTPNLLERFEDKYIPEPNSGCWIWLGATWPYPYGARGKITVAPGGIKRLASRVAYQLFVGPIPEGLFVCHKCDTPICVNPNHLFVGTAFDNMQDMARKGRGRRAGGGGGSYHRGEANPRAKLTSKQVDFIRSSSSPARHLADELGVKPATITAIRNGRAWRA